MKNTSVLVTGAGGFIGAALCQRLAADGYRVRAVTRRRPDADNPLQPLVHSWVTIDTLGPHTDWSVPLAGIDTVFHLAARVHVMDAAAQARQQDFHDTNALGTQRLASQAAALGVRRLVFLSTVKVHGEDSGLDQDGRWAGLTERDRPQPEDAYASSKWAAEQALMRVAEETGLEVVTLRPALVYGPGVRANFLRLLKWVHGGVPLPLASVDNLRSLVYLDNLVDVMVRCVTEPRAANNTFLVSDVAISTPDLVRAMAEALGRRPRVMAVSPALLRSLGDICGKAAAIDRLLGSLVIDNRRLRQTLGWSAPYCLDEGLQATARWYLRSRR